MTSTNFCKKMDITTKKAIWNWAKRLEATELTIHKDGSVTLTCEDGYICYKYRPAGKELYSK